MSPVHYLWREIYGFVWHYQNPKTITVKLGNLRASTQKVWGRSEVYPFYSSVTFSLKAHLHNLHELILSWYSWWSSLPSHLATVKIHLSMRLTLLPFFYKNLYQIHQGLVIFHQGYEKPQHSHQLALWNQMNIREIWKCLFQHNYICNCASLEWTNACVWQHNLIINKKYNLDKTCIVGVISLKIWIRHNSLHFHINCNSFTFELIINSWLIFTLQTHQSHNSSNLPGYLNYHK